MDALLRSRMEDGLNYYKSGDLSLQEAIKGFEGLIDEYINRPGKLVIPKIADLVNQIERKSFLANDVWDASHGKRVYQDKNVAVIELKKLKKILSNFTA